MSKRRTDVVGDPMLVKLPTDDEWKSSGEGGLAFFLLVPQRENYDKRRQVCIAGEILWPKQDAVVTKKWRSYTHKREWNPIDAGLLIGSTGLSLWSDKKENYFEPTYEDLTEEGKKLFDSVKSIYSDAQIVTLLDT